MKKAKSRVTTDRSSDVTNDVCRRQIRQDGRSVLAPENHFSILVHVRNEIAGSVILKNIVNICLHKLVNYYICNHVSSLLVLPYFSRPGIRVHGPSGTYTRES